MYQPVPTAKALPRRVQITVDEELNIRKWVGIGGSITIICKPPKRDVVIPEATQEEYAALYNRGLWKLIEKVPDKKASVTTEK